MKYSSRVWNLVEILTIMKIEYKLIVGSVGHNEITTSPLLAMPYPHTDTHWKIFKKIE